MPHQFFRTKQINLIRLFMGGEDIQFVNAAQLVLKLPSIGTFPFSDYFPNVFPTAKFE